MFRILMCWIDKDCTDILDVIIYGITIINDVSVLNNVYLYYYIC